MGKIVLVQKEQSEWLGSVFFYYFLPDRMFLTFIVFIFNRLSGDRAGGPDRHEKRCIPYTNKPDINAHVPNSSTKSNLVIIVTKNNPTIIFASPNDNETNPE